MVTTAGRKARRAEAAAKLSADPSHKAGPQKDAVGAGHEKRGGSTSLNQQPVRSASPQNKDSKRKGKRGKRSSRDGGGGGGGEGAGGSRGGGRNSAQGLDDSKAGDGLLASPKGKPAPRRPSVEILLERTCSLWHDTNNTYQVPGPDVAVHGYDTIDASFFSLVAILTSSRDLTHPRPDLSSSSFA